MSAVSAAPALRLALIAVCRELFDGTDVEVFSGVPGRGYVPAKSIEIQGVETDQSAATFGSSRGREESLSIDVLIGISDGGGEEVDIPITEEAYDVLGKLEYYLRVTDTTLGGVVRECMLTRTTQVGATEDQIASGRFIEITATFTAKNRIRG